MCANNTFKLIETFMFTNAPECVCDRVCVFGTSLSLLLYMQAICVCLCVFIILSSFSFICKFCIANGFFNGARIILISIHYQIGSDRIIQVEETLYEFQMKLHSWISSGQNEIKICYAPPPPPYHHHNGIKRMKNFNLLLTIHREMHTNAHMSARTHANTYLSTDFAAGE